VDGKELMAQEQESSAKRAEKRGKRGLGISQGQTHPKSPSHAEGRFDCSGLIYDCTGFVIPAWIEDGVFLDSVKKTASLYL
jgi:hypothetical protein